MSKQYNCPASLAGFLRSDSFIDLVVGPYGSTKTTTGIMKILVEAARIAPCPDGIRRSRVAWIRNTNEQLLDTSIPDFLSWFPDGLAGAFMKTGKRFLLKVHDVECEILFRGLDDTNDVRRLLSLQLSFGVMDEFREISKDIFEALQGRVGRYPNKSMNGVGCCDDSGKQIHKIWGMSNPPDFDTYWEHALSNPPTNASVFFQPSGVSPEADWLQYLPDRYYENLMESHDQDWIDVYVHAKFGKSLSGKPVFRCFDRTTNVSKNPVNLLSGLLVIGVDAGLNPTAVITQQTYDGRVVVHDAVTGYEGGMGALRFIREVLKPLLANKYSGLASVIVIDPAAFQRAQTDERSVADIYKAEGFVVKPAVTNAITARIAAVEAYLTRTVNGNPGMLVSQHVDLLIRALAGRYRYKVKTNGELEDKPEKSHPFSDVADALQYACLQHGGAGMLGGKVMAQRREIKPPPYKWAA